MYRNRIQIRILKWCSKIWTLFNICNDAGADVCQGGTLVQYEGKLRLLEIAQVPKERVSYFVSFFVEKVFYNYYLVITRAAD